MMHSSLQLRKYGNFVAGLIMLNTGVLGLYKLAMRFLKPYKSYTKTLNFNFV
jgi:hypothetical protein